jgi:hypothetical protein
MDYPMNCAVMMGLPRSGTTIISRVLGGHSQIKTAMEPYHSRRDDPYTVVDFDAFLKDFGNVTSNQSLMVKETTTSADNVELCLSLLRSSVSHGVRPLVLLVLRSPVEAYLSQVEAAETLWKEKPDFQYGERWIEIFAKMSLKYLHRFLIEADRYHKRVILYKRFISSSRDETRRLMAAFPYSYEPQQSELTQRKGMPGDPKAWQSESVSEEVGSKRTSDVKKFASDFWTNTAAQSLLRLDQAINDWSYRTNVDDDMIWADLERIVRMELLRNNMSIY